MSENRSPIKISNDREKHNDNILYKPKGIRQRFLETFKLKEVGLVPAKVISGFGTYYYGEFPEVTFEKLEYYYDRTPQLQVAVNTYADMVTGTDLQINSDDDRAKQILEDWSSKVGFYNKLKSLVSTWLVCGNAMFEKLDEDTMQDIMEVRMSSIVDKKRNYEGTKVLHYKQMIAGGEFVYLGKDISDAGGDVNNRFVEFNLNLYNRNPWGQSLFYSLAAPRTLTNGRMIKPLIEDLWEMEDSMSEIFHNHASPVKIITYPGANHEYIDKKAIEFRKMGPGDALIGDRKPDIDIIESQSQGKYEKFIDHLDSTFEVGTQFSNKLFTAGYTARASSETTEDVIAKKVRSLQKYLEMKIKREIFEPVLIINGYNPNKLNQLNLNLSFESQNILAFTANDIRNFVLDNTITKNEGREFLKDNGLDLFEDDIVAANDALLKQPTPQPVDTASNVDATDFNLPTVKESIKCQLCRENQHALCTHRRCKCKHE